jgi:uncharacterized membrane protein YoaK (UPF0700 family)
VALSFSTGTYKAICLLTFGKVFTAAQTGNLVLLGIGVAGTRQPAGPNVVTVLISLAAFAAGAAAAMGLQMNAIRSLHVPGVSTTAFTATFISLASGLAIWSLTASSTRRLTATMISLAAGAFLGDWMLSHAHPYAPAVPVIVMAVVIAIASVILKPRARSVSIGGRSLPVQRAAK